MKFADLADEDVADFARQLGLPGLVDIHVHFMPEQVLRKVWAYFDAVGPLAGREWPVQYRFDERTRLETLRRLGVLAYPALLYPHKPEMAEWLNTWAREFAERTDGCVSTGTFFPEAGVTEYVRKAIDAGTRVFKAHLQVGAYDPRDPLLDPVWGMLAEARIPVVCHCGNGPQPGEFTGVGPIGEVMRRHPELTLVVAHCGLPDYGDFLDLVERYPRAHLDTTMAFTDFVEATSPFPTDRLPQLAALRERVVLGSDYPNIPYTYGHQISALARLELGDDWLRAVLHHNGARLLASP